LELCNLVEIITFSKFETKRFIYLPIYDSERDTYVPWVSNIEEVVRMRRIRSLGQRGIELPTSRMLISIWSPFEKISRADIVIWKAWYLWRAVNSLGNSYGRTRDSRNDDEIYRVKEDASGLVRDGSR
jgi:hypothetical protein